MDADDISTVSTDNPGELAKRSKTPPADTFQLPDDWRADRGLLVRCKTCHWNGHWDDLFQVDRRQDFDRRHHDFEESLFQESASAGNLCCAAILAVHRIFHTLFDPRGSRYRSSKYSPRWSVFRRLYFSCHGQSDLAPQGTTAYPYGGHPSIEPRSEESLAWAKSIVQQCVTSHNCHVFRSKETSLPTRLVYIPNDAQISVVRLVRDTSELPSTTRYTALSHCWGTKMPPCLMTRENIDTYATKGIPWDEIPLTFRDAILYTKRLDLEYIWIDSICIIQQDPTDWSRESTRMFHYYSNAYITLGSTFAGDCNGGFFSQKRNVPNRVHLFDVRFRGEVFPLYIFRDDPEEPHLRHHEDDWNLPHSLGKEYQLFQRSWIFQERLVSPRLLFFTEKQLVFECYEGRWFQEISSPTKTTRKSIYKKLLNNTSPEEAEGLWTDILGAYGTLKITYAKDKLPAIAAVAKQFLSYQSLPHTPEHEYLCGLRKSHLHMDLSWTVDFRNGIDLNINKGPEPYLAPSWSWACVPQETTYSVDAMQHVRKTSAITLMEEHVEFATGGRFGQVLPGGYITVKGSILDCSWVSSSDDSPQDLRRGKSKLLFPGSNKTQYPLGNGEFDAYFGLDSPTSHDSVQGQVKDGKNLKKVTLLHIWTSADGDSSKGLAIGFLVLHRNSKNGRYRRLGVGSGQPPVDVRQLRNLFEGSGRSETLILE